MQENIFEWQFAIRGPNDTKFEGGIYHGRICLSRGANEPSYSRATRARFEKKLERAELNRARARARA
ncbi:putative ubiquitin-conjugating enzyme/RWD [Helianthus annuus]|nr:putative ubiquitin-conjugating enzyme/RWD [Helianthus annuus]KAJ0777673.1 putative ubiquitin-conjugating enzyme/RWD [Helianthus annuus]KAJ0786698.1 putative ubiquitin-conjugating enzyme/RWD [Helianthus annuus]